MSLKSIREEIVERYGLTGQDSFVDRQINRAASELYDEYWLYLAEREQIVQVDTEQQVIALPSDVERLIAARNYLSQAKLAVHTLRPRYRKNNWTAPFTGSSYAKFRFVGAEPLMRSYENFAPFTATTKIAAASDITLTIVGSTQGAARVKETIVLLAGARAASFSYSFTKVLEFTRAAAGTEDVTLSDVEGNELAVLPNDVLRSSYMIYQILDRNQSHGTSLNFFEILYKLRHVKLIEDEDTFLGGVYDNALYHKTVEYIVEKEEGKSDERVLAAQKCAASIKRINAQYIPDPEGIVKFPTEKGTIVTRHIRMGGM